MRLDSEYIEDKTTVFWHYIVEYVERKLVNVLKTKRTYSSIVY